MIIHHASIWKFLDAVRKDQHDSMNQIVQILAGHRRVKHPIPKSYNQQSTQSHSLEASVTTWNGTQLDDDDEDGAGAQ